MSCSTNWESHIRGVTWSLSILFRQCSYPVILHEDTNETSSSSFFILFFSGGFKSRFVDHILFSCQMLSYAGAPLNHSPLIFHLFWSAEDISEDLCFHSAFVQALPRMLSLLRHLVQPVQYLFSSNLFSGVCFEWALTHRSFPRILPDSSIFLGATSKSSKVWCKNELSSVKCLSPRSFKFFSLLVQPF